MDNIKKEVSLLGREFGDFRNNLIEFAKNYFPNIYNDFNEASPGTMFIEMASYVGDVLSYYTDVQLRESLIDQAQQSDNIFQIAQSMGYKPKLNVPATTTLSVYQLLPAIGSGDNVRPDWRYALTISEGMVVSSETNGNVVFNTLEKVRFNYSSSFDTTDVSVYSINESTNEPIYYLLKKQVRVISGENRTQTFTFGSAKPYDKIRIEDDGLIGIDKIEDSDGDIWTGVEYLAQETVFDEIPNTSNYSLQLSQYQNDTPYLLKLKKVPKRYITRVIDTDIIDIQFGAGISANADEQIVPNPTNVGSSLYNSSYNIDISIDPSNFMYSKTYGVAPSNTTLTVTYRVGNGIDDNVSQNDLTIINGRTIETSNIGLDLDTFNFVVSSLAVNNEKAAVGGRFEEEIEEIRRNAISHTRAQNRSVTKDDYLIRAYSMPPQYGSVAKAYVAPDFQINTLLDNGNDPIPNPLAINFYTLGYNSNKKLIELNNATKENLKTYISYYRILTDAINIKNAYIINIGIDFEIITLPQYNSNEVLLKCINELKKYFNTDNWSIGQPIILSNIYTLLDRIEGVQTVVRPDSNGEGGLQITNKWGGNYSPNKYSIDNATRKGVLYPAKDPSIFEIKYPDQDIRGRVVSLF